MESLAFFWVPDQGATWLPKTAKLGGLAVIGGLAYKALQNYRAGKPPIDFGADVEPAPAESPFGDTPDQDQDQQTAPAGEE